MTSSWRASARFCDDDEFYDAVVGMCSKCSDVCAVANEFCAVNCPGHTRHVIGFTGSRHVVTSPMAVKTALRGRDTLQLLLTKPLFWTSVISLGISVVATSLLVALCVCRRRRPAATQLRQRRRQLVRVAAPPSLPAAARQNEKMLLKNRLAVDNIYSDTQPYGGHVMLPVNWPKQNSCAAEDERIALRAVGSRQVSFDQESSCNISRVTYRPQSSWISWIAVEQPISRPDVERRKCDDVTELKVVCRALDERRHDDLCRQKRSEADGTSPSGEVASQMDSDTSCVMTLRQPSDAVVNDNDDDWHAVEDDDAQLKLEDARHLTSLQLSTRESPISLQGTG